MLCWALAVSIFATAVLPFRAFANSEPLLLPPPSAPAAGHGWEVELFSKPQYLGMGSGVLFLSAILASAGSIAIDGSLASIFSTAAFTFTYFYTAIHQETKYRDKYAMQFPLQGLILRHKLAKLSQRLKKMCESRGDCRTEEVYSKSSGNLGKALRVVYADDWWFEVTLDPNVIEVKHKPSTTKEMHQHKSRIEQDLYGNAASTGLYSIQYNAAWSAGHLNIGIHTAFKSDALLFRNFLVDYINHAEFALGLMQKDSMNAKAFPQSIDELMRLRKVIIDFDEKMAKDPAYRFSQFAIKELSLALQEHVYQDVAHAFAIEIKDRAELESLHRLEIRALRAPKNFEHMMLLTEMYDRRIEHLRMLDHPISLRYDILDQNPENHIKMFAKYISEIKMNLEEFIPHLTPKFQKIALKYRTVNSCSQIYSN